MSQSVIFAVNGMTCNHCKAAVEAAITDAGGAAKVDLSGHTVTVTGLSPDAAATAIRDAGYQAVPV